jgi:hypothetical protein
MAGMEGEYRVKKMRVKRVKLQVLFFSGTELVESCV